MRSVRNLGVLATIVVGVAVGAWLAGRGGSSPATTTAAAPATPAATAFRARGAFLAADRTGDVLVGLAAQPRGPVDVVVIPGDLGSVPATDVWARPGNEAPIYPVSCGARCYRFALLALEGRQVRLNVFVRGKRVRFDLPARLPPRTTLFRTAARRMAEVRTVRVHETLSSGKSGIRARFELQAPDRLRYVTSSGQRAVVIGERRWDWIDGRWRPSSYQRIRQPAYMWEGARFPRLVGEATLRGRPVRVVSAFRPDRSYPAWLRLYVTPEQRIVRAEMMAPAHFMVDRFSAFDAPLEIRPPGGR